MTGDRASAAADRYIVGRQKGIHIEQLCLSRPNQKQSDCLHVGAVAQQQPHDREAWAAKALEQCPGLFDPLLGPDIVQQIQHCTYRNENTQPLRDTGRCVACSCIQPFSLRPVEKHRHHIAGGIALLELARYLLETSVPPEYQRFPSRQVMPYALQGKR